MQAIVERDIERVETPCGVEYRFKRHSERKPNLFEKRIRALVSELPTGLAAPRRHQHGKGWKRAH